MYVWLHSKFLKRNLLCENSVVSNLMHKYRLSKAINKFCFNHCINLEAPLYALEQQVHDMGQVYLFGIIYLLSPNVSSFASISFFPSRFLIFFLSLICHSLDKWTCSLYQLPFFLSNFLPNFSVCKGLSCYQKNDNFATVILYSWAESRNAANKWTLHRGIQPGVHIGDSQCCLVHTPGVHTWRDVRHDGSDHRLCLHPWHGSHIGELRATAAGCRSVPRPWSGEALLRLSLLWAWRRQLHRDQEFRSNLFLQQLGTHGKQVSLFHPNSLD